MAPLFSTNQFPLFAHSILEYSSPRLPVVTINKVVSSRGFPQSCQNWVRLAPNETKRGLLKSRLVKIYWKLILNKCQIYPIWDQFNPISCLLWQHWFHRPQCQYLWVFPCSSVHSQIIKSVNSESTTDGDNMLKDKTSMC